MSELDIAAQRERAAKLISAICHVPTGNGNERVAALTDEEVGIISAAADPSPLDRAAVGQAIKQAETAAYDRRRIAAAAELAPAPEAPAPAAPATDEDPDPSPADEPTDIDPVTNPPAAA